MTVSNPIHQVILSRQNGLAVSPNSPHDSSKDSLYYFHLELVPPEGCYGEIPFKLEPGQKYVIQACPDVDEHPDQTLRPITLNKNIELYLECSQAQVRVSPIPCILQCQNHDDPVKFEVEVDPAYLGDKTIFTLAYRKQGRFTNLIRISKLELEGSTNQYRNPLTRLNIDLGTHPCEKIRILHVQSAEEDKIHVRVYWNEMIEFDSRISKPTLSPGPLMDRQVPPDEIVGQVFSYSSNMNCRFLCWLKLNLKKYGHKFCIILCDNTEDSSMAWEMMHVNIAPGDLPETQPPHLTGVVPIGALISMTRWLPNIRWFDKKHELQISNDTTQGNVLSYLDHKEIGHTQLERDTLNNFDVEFHQNISDFKKRLKGKLDNVGLIYLACHGIIVNGESERSILLGELKTEEQVKVYELAAILKYLHDIATRPVVMINACYSALLFQQNGTRHGLAEVMLQNIARDFIGTIGRVGTERAAQITQSLFKQSSGNQVEICIATALRDLRAEMVHRHQAGEDSTEFWLDYLYTFLYVHYGNPYTKLRLRPANRPPTGEDTE